MAREGQVEFIEDLMERHDLSRDDLADENPDWGKYEALHPHDASELIEWLRDYDKV
jgi:hypothetical protein